MSDSPTENPLVSIVLPTYNRAHVLPYAIRSVLGQTYKNLELIIVDDNSSDGTRAVVDSFHDGRLRYLRNEPNLKLPRALNKGFAAAKGAYLTWTSDDNMFTEDAIEKMVAVLRAGNCGFVYADYYLFAETDAAGKPLDARHEKLPSRLQLERTNHIGACFLYTRNAYEEVGEYDPELFLVEDYDYFIRIAQRFSFCHIPEPLYFFRRDDETLYCSRFCEVKAADVLVRYKNGLLTDEQALDAVVALILQNTEALKNPLLRWSRRLVRNVSFRLTKLHRQMCGKYLLAHMGRSVKRILEGFRTGQTTFEEAKKMLMTLMQQEGSVAYMRPAFLESSPVGKN